MVSLVKYVSFSCLAAAAVVYHAFATRQNFYPSTLYLSTSKMAVAVLGNLAFATALCVHRAVIKVFLGSLRDIEHEMIRERLASATMESLLALTIFREEFSAFFMAMFATLIFIKVLHWLVQDRVDYVEVTPTISLLQHVRITTFMVLLLVLDAAFLQYTIGGTIASGGQSVQLLFAFEYVILASTITRYSLKYAMSMVDLLMEGRWEAKGTYVFYLELVTDLLHLCVYVVFFVIVFTNYGLPLHLVRDLYSTFRNFRNRITDFLRFRQVTARLDRFPDATAEDLQRSDAVCIICREEMTATGANKRLLCGHVFHLHCLRSWLERQQNCPTCRGSVFRPRRPQAASANAGNVAAVIAAAPAAGGPAAAPPVADINARAQPPPVAAGQQGPAGVVPAGPNHARMHRMPQPHVHAIPPGGTPRARLAEGGAPGGEGDGPGLSGIPPGSAPDAVTTLQPRWPELGVPFAAQLGGQWHPGPGTYVGGFPDPAMACASPPVPLLPLVPMLAAAFPGVAPQLPPGATVIEQQAVAAAVAAAMTTGSLYSPIGGLVMLPGTPQTSIPAGPSLPTGLAGFSLRLSLQSAQSLLLQQMGAVQAQLDRLNQNGDPGNVPMWPGVPGEPVPVPPAPVAAEPTATSSSAAAVGTQLPVGSSSSAVTTASDATSTPTPMVAAAQRVVDSALPALGTGSGQQVVNTSDPPGITSSQFDLIRMNELMEAERQRNMQMHLQQSLLMQPLHSLQMQQYLHQQQAAPMAQPLAPSQLVQHVHKQLAEQMAQRIQSLEHLFATTHDHPAAHSPSNAPQLTAQELLSRAQGQVLASMPLQVQAILTQAAHHLQAQQQSFVLRQQRQQQPAGAQELQRTPLQQPAPQQQEEPPAMAASQGHAPMQATQQQQQQTAQPEPAANQVAHAVALPQPREDDEQAALRHARLQRFEQQQQPLPPQQ